MTNLLKFALRRNPLIESRGPGCELVSSDFLRRLGRVWTMQNSFEVTSDSANDKKSKVKLPPKTVEVSIWGTEQNLYSADLKAGKYREVP